MNGHISTINELDGLARDKGGICLSNRYITNTTKLDWRCKNGHIWSAMPKSIKKGHWCPKCMKGSKYTIQDMQTLAKKRHGKCLSKKYKRSDIKLEWECENGHKWFAKQKHIQQGKWCPYCNNLIGENALRQYCNKLFNKQFIKDTPYWLKYKGNQLELDCYNKELKLAFEYDGVQHKRFIKYFHKTYKTFLSSQERDRVKDEICKENGILLIRIYQSRKLKKLLNCLISKIKEKGLSEYVYTYEIDYKDLDLRNQKFEEIKRYAQSKGGKCISKYYKGYKEKLQWMCSNGHIWDATYAYIRRGYWCIKCSNKKPHPKLTIKDFKKIAQEHNGFCLSNKYTTNKDKLQFQCENGHRWFTRAENIRAGKWCPGCCDLKLNRPIREYVTVC